ncbi:metallo-dependent hydrolase [Celerinatantimonas diazotrophica]|uniref:Putative amidohydrolase n=1 Tax=Celerinatantimonas diazotrophica TaxID=412034 RepID=A0A4R1KIA4_9GAMM|nr:metallo-dependent hydrolase [Celerinatantimonas diazotrophica]TCK63970.1 putative amidohydrolase [Celerinatantimonas diazotrophica]CAG9297055.1 Deacetylase [Celerinatantimonas diazotrophica]
MKLDLLIKNGTILDLQQRQYIRQDIGVNGNKIVDLSGIENYESDTTIDAEGAWVLPGLIDFHTHVFHGGLAIAVDPNIICLPNGVTSVVDAGSSGCTTFNLFKSSVVEPSRVRIKSYLNVVSVGLSTLGGPTGYLENIDPAHYNQAKIAQLLAENPDQILGLKLRYSEELFHDHPFKQDPFMTMVDMAQQLNTNFCVHVTDSHLPAPQLIEHFRESDIFAHCYQGKGNTILDEQGNVYPELVKAQQRGVIFDCSNGVAHFHFKVAQTAMEQGFYPDVISTDMTLKNSLRTTQVYSLLMVMSKYLNMGMPIFDIIKAVTETPARLMKMDGQIGTLKPGAFADIAIVKLVDQPFTFDDSQGNYLKANQIIENCATILDGQIVYRRPSL